MIVKKFTHKMNIKKFKDFLFEYEGGPSAKDQIKVSDKMLTYIKFDDEEEDEDFEDVDIPILKNDKKS